MAENKFALPYGLCKKFGITLKKNATPRDAWEALKKKTGMSPEHFYSDLDSKIYIGKSVGAKFSNYKILDKQSGETFRIVEGTYIQNVQIFAGKGTRKKLNEFVIEGLVGKYGGSPEGWQHCKGIAQIDCIKEVRKAEIHWFQEKGAGRHNFKIKEWL